MSELLEICAAFLDPVVDVEDWGPGSDLFKARRYRVARVSQYPGGLVSLPSPSPRGIHVPAGVFDNELWEDLLDSALDRANERLAFQVRFNLFSYQNFVSRFIGVWRLEFSARGQYVILVNKLAVPQPRCFRTVPFFRKLSSDSAVLQPS